MKWVAVAAAGIAIVLGILLWQVTREGEARPANDPPPPRPMADVIDAAPYAATIYDAAPGPDAEPGVFVVKSEEFWDRVDEFPHDLRGMAAACYEGGSNRKAKIKLSYQLSVDRHVVTCRNVKVMESTLNDPRLEQCMIRTLENARWDDKEMPDFVSPENDPEEVLIRIENLKRYMPHQDSGMK